MGASLFAGIIGAGLFGYRTLSGSLPALTGELRLEGLESAVTVERDRLGVPTVRADNRIDAARALGFLHAQERFFQMDLMRRRAAGELSELVGASALVLDRRHRVHRMRERAKRIVERAAPPERELLEAYVGGVNAGLRSLDAYSFEYVLLRTAPRLWTLDDSVLVVLSMFFELNDDRGRRESDLGLLDDVLPRELFELLTAGGTEWDAPIVGDPFGTPDIPSPQNFRLGPGVMETPLEGSADLGSNNWAVAGTRTADGRALLANDMHLGHAVPNIWYRAVLHVGAEPGRRLVGVTLPGTPSLVVGSNGFLAWGFTNSTGDWTDLVELEIDPSDPGRYRTPDGFRSFEIHSEGIAVRDAEPIELPVRETVWGPVIDEDHEGRPRALRWIAHDPEGVNLRLGLMEEARTVEEALSIAPTVGIPPQNFVCADREGSIGWTIAGRIPARVGFDGSLPGPWGGGERSWNGFLPAEEYPAVIDPPSGIVWTANARVVEGDDLKRIGDGGYALGARAGQIRDALRALAPATEEDLLAIQLDDRALLLERWRELFLELVSDRPELSDVERALRESWTGRASVDSAGYRIVKELRRALFTEVFTSLTLDAGAADDRFHISSLRQYEDALYRLVTERPAHLVPPPHESWEEALVGILKERAASWPSPLETYTWGDRNRSAIRHPLSGAVPILSRFLDMESRPLPGDTDMPRVQGPSHGASERLVVSPGREQDGIFHMPGGQSGHPLSPFYGAGHEDWEEGRPTPLLPGETVYRLTLTPDIR